MSELLPEYKKELEDFNIKLLGAQAFAEQFPVFKEEILNRKLTKSFTGKIGDRYKKLYFAWGINRYFYETKERIINCRTDFEPQYLWNIYINQVSIFGDSYRECGLPEPEEGVDVFFFDNSNTTFYATDEQLIPLLEKLNDWYEKSLPLYQAGLKELKRKELLKQLEELK